MDLCKIKNVLHFAEDQKIKLMYVEFYLKKKSNSCSFWIKKYTSDFNKLVLFVLLAEIFMLLNILTFLPVPSFKKFYTYNLRWINCIQILYNPWCFFEYTFYNKINLIFYLNILLLLLLYNIFPPALKWKLLR